MRTCVLEAVVPGAGGDTQLYLQLGDAHRLVACSVLAMPHLQSLTLNIDRKEWQGSSARALGMVLRPLVALTGLKSLEVGGLPLSV